MPAASKLDAIVGRAQKWLALVGAVHVKGPLAFPLHADRRVVQHGNR